MNFLLFLPLAGRQMDPLHTRYQSGQVCHNDSTSWWRGEACLARIGRPFFCLDSACHWRTLGSSSRCVFGRKRHKHSLHDDRLEIIGGSTIWGYLPDLSQSRCVAAPKPDVIGKNWVFSTNNGRPPAFLIRIAYNNNIVHTEFQAIIALLFRVIVRFVVIIFGLLLLEIISIILRANYFQGTFCVSSNTSKILWLWKPPPNNLKRVNSASQ